MLCAWRARMNLAKAFASLIGQLFANEAAHALVSWPFFFGGGCGKRVVGGLGGLMIV